LPGLWNDIRRVYNPSTRKLMWSTSKMPPRDPKNGSGFVMGGQADFDYGWALLDSERTGDFTKLLEHAAGRFREDTDSNNLNTAPKAFWPSGAMYRTIFYRMGKLLGEKAAQRLDSVPDPDLLLFAQIELAAGLCGLPELAGITHRLPAPRMNRLQA